MTSSDRCDIITVTFSARKKREKGWRFIYGKQGTRGDLLNCLSGETVLKINKINSFK